MEKKFNRKKLVNGIKTLIYIGVAIYIIRTFFIGNFRIPTTSMVPTLQVGDRLISNNFIYRIRPPRRGEVIIFKFPDNPKRDFVKRLIALPGERVRIKEGKIYINGREVKDPRISCRYYYSEGEFGGEKEVEVPENCYYVLGDNSFNSKDSRYWGFVPKKYLIGKALFIYWPPWRIGFIK